MIQIGRTKIYQGRDLTLKFSILGNDIPSLRNVKRKSKKRGMGKCKGGEGEREGGFVDMGTRHLF